MVTKTAKQWRAEAQRLYDLAQACEHAGMNQDAEMHYAAAIAAAAIATSINTARAEHPARPGGRK
jgi:hypothetical protein